MDYKNIVFLGTSHISKESYEEVTSSISSAMPDIVAVELDKKRAYALMSKSKPSYGLSNIRRIGVKGYIFALLGSWAEKKLGELTGFSPGSEMKEALRLAKEKGIPIALIDQDIEVTLKRLSKYLSWKEKFNFLIDILKAVILRKSEFQFDLNKVPEKEVIKKLLDKVRTRYPNVYRVLIAERNRHMYKALKKLAEENPKKKILAIMGAGHVDDIRSMIKSRSDVT
ncbi:TraB/GumN family protein [Candidatus Woesearchaeota archaeon]|nr:TraB/GumN family protein [Candidatus Woesearchaeota archaeon]MBI2660633.1 TraB/GumN family protein [Candidatus Woesearchaeota archaeon]